MADDVTLKDGANADFVAAADEIGGKKFQRVKMTWGVDGVAVDQSAANPAPTTDEAVRLLMVAVKAVLDTLKTQNDTALTHLSTSDTQMANLIAALASVGLDAGTNTVGYVGVNAPNGSPVAATNRFPVATGVSATPTDRSLTITSGGTAQQLAAAKADRTFLIIQNQDLAVDLYVRVTGTAAANQTSLKIPPGQAYEFPAACVPIGAVSVISSKTGHLVFAQEY